MTPDEALLPGELASWPAYVPPPAVLGHVELLLGGAYEPLTGFLDEHAEATVRSEGRLPNGRPCRLPLTLEVPEPVGEAAGRAGHLVIADEEGTPLAQVDVEKSWPVAHRAGARVAGRVHPLRASRSGPFRALRLRPDEVRRRLAGTPALGVPLRRPLLAAEEGALVGLATAQDARLLLLPCVAETGPSGLPPEVLVRSVRASTPRLPTPAGPAVVAAVPLVPGMDDVAPAGLAEFAAAAGATLTGAEALDSGSWAAIAAALDAEAGRLERIVAGDVAAVLRSWRAPRPDRGLTVFFTGLSGSGKSTLARGLVDALIERGRTVTLLDGDATRRLLSAGLGFGRADRDLNIRRIGWVASEVTRHGGVAVCAPIAPYAATRADVRRMVETHGGFVLVHVATPLAVCEQRDRKGLYAKARAGLIPEFTGVSDPYEQPTDADIRLDTSVMPVDAAVGAVLDHLERGGWLR